jgi:glycosyltransferase involved in cell wall biosynthesis
VNVLLLHTEIFLRTNIICKCGDIVEKPLVSVILPVYGVEPYLNQCVESLVNQTYRNIEIILVDDGSKDRCPQIIDEWAKKDSRIVPIHKINGGQSSARNKGLDVAKGKYITFVDSDDWVEKEYCEKLLYAMRLYNAEIAVCSFSRIYNRKIVREPFFIDGKSVFYPCVPDQAIKYFIENAIAVWGKMYRSDILKDIRFPEGRLAEEYVFQLKALLSTQVVAFCNKYLYDYRIREDSDAHSIKPKYLLDNIQAIDEAYHVCSEHFVFEQDYCKKHLASLVYEFKSASRFGEDVLLRYSNILNHAIETVGGMDLLINTMDEPENILFYVRTQFGKYMTKQEKKKVQSDYRKIFSWNLLPKYKLRFLLKYLPSAINLDVTSKILSLKK